MYGLLRDVIDANSGFCLTLLFAALGFSRFWWTTDSSTSALRLTVRGLRGRSALCAEFGTKHRTRDPGLVQGLGTLNLKS